MIPPSLYLGLGSLLLGVAWLSLGAWLAAKYKTPLLRSFLGLGLSLLGISLSFFLRDLRGLVEGLGRGGPEAEAALALGRRLDLLGLVSLLAGSLGILLVLPALGAGLFGRSPGRGWKGLSRACALGMVVLFGARSFIVPASLANGLLSASLFVPIGLSLGILGYWLYAPRPPQAEEEGEAKTLPGLPANARGLKAFFGLSAAFLPLFLVDSLVLPLPGLPAWLKYLDNCTLPLYLALVEAGALALIPSALDHPPLMEEGRVTSYARTSYGLTGREAEVLEYIMEGYTLRDLARVLGIAQKTAENHLYAVYQKTGVTNRIQLYQTFQNNSRKT